MRKTLATIAALSLLIPAIASAQMTTIQGGTGSTSPSGILYGITGSLRLATLVIGSGLQFVGGALSATGLASYDAFTHPIVGSSATTSLMLLNGQASTSQFTVGGSTYLATTSGNVGIGTEAPIDKLHITGNIYDVTGNTLYGGPAGSFGGILPYIAATGDTRIFTGRNGTHNIIFASGNTLAGGTGGVENMRIVGNNGFVAIGTTTPNYLLTVATSSNPQLALSAGAGVQQWFARAEPGGQLSIGTTTVPGTATSTADALTIDNNGAVIANCFKNPGGNCITTVIGTSTPGIQGQNVIIDAGGLNEIATSTIFTATNSKVGISTTTPLSQVSIVAPNQSGSVLPNSGTTPTGSLLSLRNGNVNNAMFFGMDGTPFEGYIQVSDVSNLATHYNLALQPLGGSVGVGTTSPEKTLTVNGTLAASGRISSYATAVAFEDTNDGTSPNSIHFQGTGNDTYFGHESTTAGGFFSNSLANSTVIYSSQAIQLLPGHAAVLIALGNGNVGIGTTTPNTSLDVNGNIYVENQGALRLSETRANGGMYAALTATSSMAANVTWSLPATDGTIGQVLTTNGAGSLLWTTAGSGAAGSSPWATTTSQVSGQNIVYPLNTTDVVTVGNTSTTTAPVWFDPNALVNYFQGRVGVGTTTPNGTLSISSVSTAKLTISSLGSGTGIFGDNGSSNGMFSITREDSIGNTGDVAFTGFAGVGLRSGVTAYRGVPTAYDFYDAPSHNIGIGTTSPDATLTVNSVAGASGRTWAAAAGTVALFDRAGGGAVESITTSATGVDSIWFGNPSQQAAGILQWDNSANAMSLWTGSGGSASQRLTIGSTGLVGIGTTTPYGQLSLGGGNLIVGASTAGGTPGDLFLPKLGTAAGAFLAVDPTGKVIATTTPTTGTNYFTNSGIFTYLSTGTNLGIGSTTPYSPLGISVPATNNAGIVLDATTGFTGNLIDLKLASSSIFTVTQGGALTTTGAALANIFRSSGTGSASTPNYSFNADPDTGIYKTSSGNADSLSFATGGLQRGVIDPLGRWGIGTSTPAAMFQVASSTFQLVLSNPNAGTDLKHWAFFTDTTGKLGISTASDALATTERFSFLNNGSLGISSTSPFAALSVGSPTSSINPFAVATSTNGFQVFEIDQGGHHITSGAAPKANSCAGFTITGDDETGTVTFTSALTCSITFAKAYAATPVCTINATTAIASAVTTIATTGFTVTGASAISGFRYICQQHQ